MGTEHKKHKMHKNNFCFFFPFLCLLCSVSLFTSLAQSPDALFQTRCAECHNTGNTVGAPMPQTLGQMSWQAILAALETGKMRVIGDSLSPTEREAIAKHIGTSDSHSTPLSFRCSSPPQHRAGTGWNGWSDVANTRFQPSRQPGLTTRTTP